MSRVWIGYHWRQCFWLWLNLALLDTAQLYQMELRVTTARDLILARRRASVMRLLVSSACMRVRRAQPFQYCLYQRITKSMVQLK